MGMHLGLIVIKGTVEQFHAAFTQAWPLLEVVDSEKNLPNAQAFLAWKAAHEQFVSAAKWSKDNPGKEVFVFWQDGPWAILLDPSYTLASDDESLLAMSARLGTVLSFVVETAGGCAFFACFENGAVRRKISNADSDVTLEGEPLSEESGIDVANYYMDETEKLWNAFGLKNFEQLPGTDNCMAICVVDRTDYGDLAAGTASKPPAAGADSPAASAQSPAAKPWWKIF